MKNGFFSPRSCALRKHIRTLMSVYTLSSSLTAAAKQVAERISVLQHLDIQEVKDVANKKRITLAAKLTSGEEMVFIWDYNIDTKNSRENHN